MTDHLLDRTPMLVSNEHLPGYTTVSEIPMDGEELRREVFDPHGNYIGAVVYVKRRHKAGGSSWGWRPAHNARLALTNKVDAIRRLPRMNA